MRIAVDRHLSFFHRLQQCALGLRRRSVHFVGQQHLGEDRTRMKDELPGGWIEYGVAQDIRRQQVTGELDAPEFEAEDLGQRVRQCRFADARNVLD
jgi:hypothetical protein